MTTTTTLTVPTTIRPAAPQPTSTKQLWRTGLVAGATASVATSAVAAAAHAAGVSLKVAGKAIPVPGFAQLTFVAVIIGTVIAVVSSRRAARPRRTFVATTIALTVLSIVPDVLADAHVSTRLTLALTHLVAAAIVIPAVASRLTD
jgi:hypothetical protein